MKKFNTLIIILFVISLQAVAQQAPRYSHYVLNGLSINPAYAGITDDVNIKASYRTQWTGFSEGAPKTSNLTVDAPIMLGKFGVGLEIINDQLAALQQNTANFSLSYKIKKSNLRVYSIGLSAGMGKSTLISSQLINRNAMDMAIPNEDVSIFIPDLKIGFFSASPTSFFGMSLTNLFPYEINYTDVKRENAGSLVKHFNLVYGKSFSLSDDFKFSPSFLAKINEMLNYQVDLTTLFSYKDAFSYGVTYRHQESLVLLMDYMVNKNLHIAYAFDFSTSELMHYNNGSHEIMVAYRIISHKKMMSNPRYMEY